MGLTRTVVFKVGSFPSEFTRDDIASAFYNEFSGRYSVVSIQIVPGGVVKVLFGSPETKKALCSQPVCSIGSVECEVLNFMQRSTQVQVHHYPSEADDDDLCELLRGYGEIVGIRLQHWVGLQHIATGTRLVEMKLKHDIPRNMRLEKMRLKIWYKNQPLECDICQGNHKAVECELRDKCRRCRLPGHFARECTAGAWNGHPPIPVFVPDPAPVPLVGDWADVSSCEEADAPASQSILQGVAGGINVSNVTENAVSSARSSSNVSQSHLGVNVSNVTESAVSSARNSSNMRQSNLGVNVGNVTESAVSSARNFSHVNQSNLGVNVSDVTESAVSSARNFSHVNQSNLGVNVSNVTESAVSSARNSSNVNQSNLGGNASDNVNNGNSNACQSNVDIGTSPACAPNDSVGPDLELSPGSSGEPMDEGQVVNSPLPSPGSVESSPLGELEEGECVEPLSVLSVESSDLDSGDSVELRQVLSGRPGRSGKSSGVRHRSLSPVVRSRSPGVATLAVSSVIAAKSVARPAAKSGAVVRPAAKAVPGARRAAKPVAKSGLPGVHLMPPVIGRTPRSTPR